MNVQIEHQSWSNQNVFGIAKHIETYLSHNSNVAKERVLRERPLVSVLLPVFNGAAYVRKSIESLLAQTYTNLEIIVVDDGSTDTTADIIRDLQQNDSRIQYHYQENSGIVDALNAGLDLATGTFIARQDADDISIRTRIEKQLVHLYANPNYIAVSGGLLDIDTDDSLTGRRFTPPDPRWADYAAYPAYEPYLPHPFLMMNAEVLRNLRYRYVFHAEDADLYWRAAKVGELSNISDPIGFYRIHQNSITGNSAREGRIQAIFSQLAAISAARVDMLQEDLQFQKSYLAECRSLNGFKEMIDFLSSQLTERERKYLTLASALKLLEFTTYRPYKLEKPDVDFILSVVDPLAISHCDSRRYAKKLLRHCYREYLRCGSARYQIRRLTGKILPRSATLLSLGSS